MANNIITVPLPADLPENWNDTQYVSPGGTEAGLSEQHGFNYLMKQVNNVQTAANELDAEAERMKNSHTSHVDSKNNPHGVTAQQIGLGNVNNTSDADKPISTATRAALNTKLDASQKGAASGVASLGSDGKVPSGQLPAMNYAPSGFGLGGNAKTLGTNDNFDNYTNCGFYGVYISSVMQSIANRPPYGFETGEFELLVHNSGHQNYLIQELTNNDTNVKCRRYRYNGKFYEWEYINPPMEVGVSYRTTERYKNQVVFAKVNSSGKIEKYLADGTVLPDYIYVFNAVVG